MSRNPVDDAAGQALARINYDLGLTYKDAHAALIGALDAVPRQVADAWLDERDAARAEADRAEALRKIRYEAVDAPHARQIASEALAAEDGDE